MGNGTNGNLVKKPHTGHFHVENHKPSASPSGHNLRVTVITTNREGTQAALRMAGNFARDLGARITLLAVHHVPFHFPLEKPPVSLDFLERNETALVYESGVQADEVSVRVVLCRNRKECLKQVLKPRSLILIGGKRRRWLNKAHELRGWLDSLGHQVVYVDVASRYTESFISRGHALVRTMLARLNRADRCETNPKTILIRRSAL